MLRKSSFVLLGLSVAFVVSTMLSITAEAGTVLSPSSFEPMAVWDTSTLLGHPNTSGIQKSSPVTARARTTATQYLRQRQNPARLD